jgi:phage-related protein
MTATVKPLVWLHGEVKTPPLSPAARLETGFLLRKLQQGERLGMPWSRPMPSIGKRCHELRINDGDRTWRIAYRVDDDAIVILEVFQKQTQQTPQSVAEACKRRIRLYDTKG